MKLYHYCGLDKGLSILKYGNIRMSDIAKSNDFAELELFFPELHNTILERYVHAPFSFRYKKKTDLEAMRELVFESRFFWESKFENGDFANFVICFSEEKDCLSQWRGYADDAKGMCLGFSNRILQKYVDATDGVLTFTKVKYISREEVTEIIAEYADEILKELKELRKWIVDEMTHDDEGPNTDGLLGFNFDGMLSSAFSESLGYKLNHFSSENEWRIFFTTQAYKQPEWVYRESKEPFSGPKLFPETLAFLNNRIDFRWTNDDLIPYCPLLFEDFDDVPVKEVWLGPKCHVNTVDMKLFLKKANYPEVTVHRSAITYR